MQAGDHLVEHPVAVGLSRRRGFVAERAAGPDPAAHQLAVAGIGPQTLAAMLQKLQAPLPVRLAQIPEAPGAVHRHQLAFGIKARSAGQAGEVLQQHIEGQLGRPARFHQPLRQAPAHGAHLQQLEGVGGHEQHLRCAAWGVGAAAGPLQQPGQVFGRADLHHPLHRLEVHPQVEGAGAHHPAQRPRLHAGLDRLPFGAVDGAVMER